MIIGTEVTFIGINANMHPLQHVTMGGPRVVLGVLISKNDKFEDKDTIKACVAKAAEYVPLEHQREKLRDTVEVSEEIFEE